MCFKRSRETAKIVCDVLCSCYIDFMGHQFSARPRLRQGLARLGICLREKLAGGPMRIEKKYELTNHRSREGLRVFLLTLSRLIQLVDL